MPGFDIDLPAGRVGESGSRYRNGRLILHDIGGTECGLMLVWDPGDLFDDDAIKTTNKLMAAQWGGEPRPIPFAAPIAVAGAGATSSWAFGAGSQIVRATQVACGARRLILMTFSARGDAEGLHRRMAGSMRCRPDAAQERMIDDVPVVFGLGPGWFRITKENPDLVLTNRRWRVSAITIQSSAFNSQAVESVIAGGAFPGVSLRERAGDDWLIEMPKDGEPLRGLATIRNCSESGQALLLMALADKDEEARKLLAGAHCRKQNEAPERWLDLPAGATSD